MAYTNGIKPNDSAICPFIRLYVCLSICLHAVFQEPW